MAGEILDFFPKKGSNIMIGIKKLYSLKVDIVIAFAIGSQC